MAIVAVGALASTGFAAAGSTLLAGALGMSALLTTFLANAALGLALNALSPKPKTAGANRGYQVNTRGSALDHQIIYGTMKVGGAIVFDGTTGTNNKFLHRVIAYAGHEIESFHEIYINDELLTLDGSGNVTSPSRYNGKVRIKGLLGTTNQVADPDLVSEVPEWTSNHRLRGIAYLYIRLAFDADAFPNGVPTITTVIKGKKVFDPRNSTTAWSDNPALCMRDYLVSDGYGLGEDAANLDDTLISTAANVCEFFNYPTLTGATRFTTNGAFTTALTPYDLLGDLLTSMGGLLWYGQGKWRMKPAYYVAPTVAFDEDDIRSSITVSTRVSRRDNFNIVKGTFRGEETNWQVTDYPEVTNSAFVAADNGEESVIDIDLPFTSDAVTARRIARIALERNRQQITVGAAFGMRALQVQTGDIITLTNSRFGWTNKEFEVVSWTFGLADTYDLQTQLSLRETAESVFDDVSDGVVYERDNTTLLSPFEVPSIGLSATVRLQILKESLKNIVTLNVTSGAPARIDRVEVEFRKDGDTEFTTVGTGSLGTFDVAYLDDGLYDFRARAVNTFGVKGEFENLVNVSAEGLAQPPQDVLNLSSEVNGAVINLSWTAVTDLDLSYYRIRYTPNITTASWASSVDYSDKIPRPATSTTVPARAGTFLIKAVDKSGIESTNTGQVVVRVADLENFVTTLTQTEDPTFTGSKTNCEVSNNTLKIAELLLFDSLAGDIDSLAGNWDDLGFVFVGTSASYDFSNYIDVGSVKRSRIYVDSYTARFNSLGGNIDALAGLLDVLPGLWDDLTETGNFADTNVKAFVSTTNDDPSGSPTWSNYLPLRVSDISARAFRFKINLESDTSGITPSVLELAAIVQHN
jgi:hypothetical protein